MSTVSDKDDTHAKKLAKLYHEFMDHYDNHITGVIIQEGVNCGACRKLIEQGKILEDERKFVKGLQRTAQPFGNEIYVLVPKTWIGKKVNVSLIDEA